MRLLVILTFSAILFSCKTKTEEKVELTSAKILEMAPDPHSFANSQEVSVVHLLWKAAVDFDKQVINATATWTLNQNTADKLILDTRGLSVSKVLLDDKSETTFRFGDTIVGQEFLGIPLIIDLLPGTKTVSIEYVTSPDAAAVQWLNTAQTRDKKFPFLFTQSQAILARTWLPCMDGPGIRFTYEASVQVPAGMLALMSAANPVEKNTTGLYTFKMEQPIPSYLMALAAGDLAFRPIGEQTGVYAEPSFVDACAAEIADMQIMLEKAEQLYGDYRWGRYDVLVLPPSFPFGGMENPRITFATPTIISGDKSLVALIAHELAHSWSGNLVTNANWNDFWLNEGFTVYFEGRIMEAVYGKDYSDMLHVLEYDDLISTVEEMGKESPDTHLHLNLAGRDPDEGMTEIAYNKGAFLLRLLENTAGRDAWDAFLKQYFSENAFKTMTTESFINYLNTNLIDKSPEKFAGLNINAWIYGPGIPANCPQVVSTRFMLVDSAIASYNKGASPQSLKTADWTTHEWLRFLAELPADITLHQMAELDKAFGFTHSGNAEVVDKWFELALRKGYTEAYDAIETFL
ncbi:MAG: leukotriene A4 hydrolase C-terminal domain-containing protein, partial [Chitinophagales bacterium]